MIDRSWKAWAGALALAVCAPGGAARAQMPMSVTTDTPEYCAELTAKVATLSRSGTGGDARAMAAEGERLCAEGQVRRGVWRLRQALLALEASHRR